MSAVLTVKNLRKSFGTEVVLEDISFEVKDHSATVFIGASGSGKSTLLRCINLLEGIDDGVMELDGQEITAVEIDPDQIRRRLGMVFQSFNLFPHMSVIKNITLAPMQVQGLTRDEAYERGLKLLDRFGLRAKADEYPDRLSGGQQQRVAIIRSLACEPRLLLLDEITSALDPVLVNEVLVTVRDLKNDGMTMVIATHEMGFARQVADQLCYLHRGRIIERGIAAEVIDDPQRAETKEFLARVHSAGRL